MPTVCVPGPGVPTTAPEENTANTILPDTSDPSVHEGHRSRLRDRFLNCGLDAFEDHEVLELLLFYASPRRDVNPTAHRLMERYGSLSAVLDASPAELEKTEGIGENSAVLLSLARQLARRYSIDAARHGNVLDTPLKAGKYLKPFFLGLRDEAVYLVTLDAGCRVIQCRMLSSGTAMSATVSVRGVAELALRDNAVSVLLAHNHPGGMAVPSREDEETTRALRKALKPLDIKLNDHFIIADGECVSMADLGLLKD